jgi:hypothetical protein
VTFKATAHHLSFNQLDDWIKRNENREITRCPRALEVMRAQFALRERMVAWGLISHKVVFFSAAGEPLETTYVPCNRWTEVLETPPVRLRQAVQRSPSVCRSRSRRRTSRLRAR